jgi:hypothetical protein
MRSSHKGIIVGGTFCYCPLYMYIYDTPEVYALVIYIWYIEDTLLFRGGGGGPRGAPGGGPDGDAP